MPKIHLGAQNPCAKFSNHQGKMDDRFPTCLPEKTKFQVSKVISAPNPPTPSSSLRYQLGVNSLKLLSPDLGPLIGEDGTWNRTEPSFRFERLDSSGNPTGTIYNSLAEVPGLDEDLIINLNARVEDEYTQNFKDNFLSTLNSQNTEVQNIFQLDPNQLLTRSEGYKVLLRRSL